MSAHDDSRTRITEAVRPEPDGMRPPRLVFLTGGGVELGGEYRLEQRETFIGRAHECQVYLDRDAISRRHAVVRRSGEGWHLVDLGSTNGCYVNDERVERALLRDGDLVQIGDVVLKFLDGRGVESRYYDELRRLGTLDPGTGTYNRRYIEELLRGEIARCLRHRHPLSVALLDIDAFKQLNDRHGHLAGDAVLLGMAGTLRQQTRREEFVARYGGEEFLIVLLETGRDGALSFAERVRAAVEGQTYGLDGQALRITVSIGVATLREGAPGGLRDLLQEADGNLYRAKRAGRNRVVG